MTALSVNGWVWREQIKQILHRPSLVLTKDLLPTSKSRVAQNHKTALVFKKIVAIINSRAWSVIRLSVSLRRLISAVYPAKSTTSPGSPQWLSRKIFAIKYVQSDMGPNAVSNSSLQSNAQTHTQINDLFIASRHNATEPGQMRL